MVHKIPEIVKGIQFAVYDNVMTCFRNDVSVFAAWGVGICIAVQVCMIQIPVLVLFNAFYVRLLKHFYTYVVTISFCI